VKKTPQKRFEVELFGTPFVDAQTFVPTHSRTSVLMTDTKQPSLEGRIIPLTA
jgi:hypothetical protein